MEAETQLQRVMVVMSMAEELVKTDDNNHAGSVSRQMLECAQQLVLLEMSEVLLKSLRNKEDCNKIFPLLKELSNYASARTNQTSPEQPVKELIDSLVARFEQMKEVRSE